MDRREFLTVAAIGAAGGVAGCGGSGCATSQSEWFTNVDNYDGEVDRTGRDRTTVSVGSSDGFAFGPAAIRVDTGTTVVWEWTGEGGRHNVIACDGPYSSAYYREAGATFEYTFDAAGLSLYYCEPHQEMGMKGSVRAE